MAPLGLLSEGERAKIMQIGIQKGYKHGNCKSQICHLEDMGLRVGKIVEVLNNAGNGSFS